MGGGGLDEDALVDVPRAAVAGARGHSIEHKGFSSMRVGFWRAYLRGSCSTGVL